MSTPNITAVAGWINDAEFAGFFVAESQGLYQKMGVHHTWMSGASLDPLEIVATGRAQVGLTASTDYLLMFRSKGAPVVAFAVVYQKSPAGLMSLASHPILKPKDLIGKRIGLQASAHQAFDALLVANNLSMDQMTIVTVAFDPSPLTSHQVDAFWAFATNRLVAE